MSWTPITFLALYFLKGRVCTECKIMLSDKFSMPDRNKPADSWLECVLGQIFQIQHLTIHSEKIHMGKCKQAVAAM